MKKTQAYLLGALLISGVALAQDGSQAQSNSEGMSQKQASDSADSSEAVMTEQARGQIRSRQLIEGIVMNGSDEEIGSITDIIVNQDGQVAGIIVAVGGFLGMGEKNVALSWDSIEIAKDEDEDDYQVTTSIGNEELKDAAAFKTEERQRTDEKMEQTKQQIEQLENKQLLEKEKEKEKQAQD